MKLLVEKYLPEAKRKPIPKVKGKGKYHFGIKYETDGWYQDPKMAGHTWSGETLDALEKVLNTYSKSKMQKWLIDKVYGTPQEIKNNKYWKTEDSWHFFNQISKKEIANLQWVLRRIDKAKKDGMYALLSGFNNKSSMLKDRMTWALEELAYRHDKEKYLEGYIRTFGFYGMSREEAMDRFERYHKGISKKISGQSKGMMGH